MCSKQTIVTPSNLLYMYHAEQCDGIWGILCLCVVGILSIIGGSLMYSNNEKDFPANEMNRAFGHLCAHIG